MSGEYITQNVKLTGDEMEGKREQIRDYFLKTYELYERLFEIVQSDEVFYDRPESLRHPIIFYFGHTAVFYINKLLLTKKCERINPRFESLFAIGVDEMSWDDLDEKRYEWPSVSEVREYRDAVKNRVESLILSEPLSLPITQDSFFWAILMGCEHERIHLETSSVLIRQLPVERVKEHPLFEVCAVSGDTPKNEMVLISGGHISIGKQRDGEFYGWDNEYGSFSVELNSFFASKNLVTNGEFLEFVRDGGYERVELWGEEGRSWLEYKKAIHPPFWKKTGEGYLYRAITKEIEMPLDWPVDVNYHEAKAYCNWLSLKDGRTYRLPTEAEWYAMAKACVADEELKGGNINLEKYASAMPVGANPQGVLNDAWGNVWQWSETPIFGFEGFFTHPLYDDFSTPTFDGRHNLIKGGSFISTGNERLLSARYAFRRHFFQHAGFRYVVSGNDTNDGLSVYESDRAVSEYLEFHYGDEYFGVPNFPSKIARIALSLSAGTPQSKALELGCSVGRCSFELAKVFESVVGIDFSARFIKNGVMMQKEGVVRYKLKMEGELYEQKEVFAEDCDIDEDVRARVEFWQGDACNLKDRFRGYDLVVAANLIDRLYAPKRFLQGVHELLNIGGVLVLASPYSWDESFCEKSEWVCGKNGSLAKIREILSKHFIEFFEPMDVEFVLRESDRKFQHTVSQVTAYKRVR